MKNVNKPLSKSILIPLALTAAAEGTRIYKKKLPSRSTTFIVSCKEIEDIMEIVKSLEEFGLLKGTNKTIENKVKE